MVKYVRIKCAAGAIFFVHTAVLSGKHLNLARRRREIFWLLPLY